MVEMIDLCAILRHDDSFVFRTHNGCGEFLWGIESQRYARIVFLAVEDSCMNYGTSDACLPILCVGAIQALRAVREGQLQHTTERTFLSVHAIRTAGRDDFVGPPARSHLS